MDHEIVNVFAIIFLDDSNQIVANSIRFYIGQLLVIEYSFETPILFCTVLNLEKRVHLKSSIPYAGSHLIACDKDGKGHVWLINEIIAQIKGMDSQNEKADKAQSCEKSQESPISIKNYLHEPENSITMHNEDNDETCSDEELFSDVMSTITDVSTISLPREPAHLLLPNPHPLFNIKPQEGGDDHSEKHTQSWECEEDPGDPIPTPQPRPTRSIPAISPFQNLPECDSMKKSSLKEDTTNVICEPPQSEQTSELDEYGFVLTNSKPPRRLRIQPETTKLCRPPIQPERSLPEVSQEEMDVARNAISNNVVSKPSLTTVKPIITSQAADQTSASSSTQEAKDNNRRSNEDGTRNVHATSLDTTPMNSLTPSIIPNSSKRLEYRLARKQAEQFNEEAARLVLQEGNTLFQKNEAEKVLNYSPNDAMFGKISSNNNEQERIETFETRVRKQVNKKYLKEAKERPSLMNLYNKDDWEKEITLQSTGPRIIYSIGVDQFEKPSPHSKTENEYIRKYLKQNPIV